MSSNNVKVYIIFLPLKKTMGAIMAPVIVLVLSFDEDAVDSRLQFIVCICHQTIFGNYTVLDYKTRVF
jgi:hypothetical protein